MLSLGGVPAKIRSCTKEAWGQTGNSVSPLIERYQLVLSLTVCPFLARRRVVVNKQRHLIWVILDIAYFPQVRRSCKPIHLYNIWCVNGGGVFSEHGLLMIVRMCLLNLKWITTDLTTPLSWTCRICHVVFLVPYMYIPLMLQILYYPSQNINREQIISLYLLNCHLKLI